MVGYRKELARIDERGRARATELVTRRDFGIEQELEPSWYSAPRTFTLVDRKQSGRGRLHS